MQAVTEQPIKKNFFFRISTVSPGNQPLAKDHEDSGYQIEAGTTSFPWSLLSHPSSLSPGDGKRRDPGNEVEHDWKAGSERQKEGTRDIKVACVAVVSVSFKPSGVSARGYWHKKEQKSRSGGRGVPSPPLPPAPFFFCSFFPNALARLRMPRLA